jgi:hypothetical protein
MLMNRRRRVAESMVAALENAIVVAGALGDEIEQQSLRQEQTR